MSEERIKWPNNAKCCVMLSFDVDGETIWKEGPEGKSWPWPRNRTQGTYGPTRSVPRILEMLERRGVKGTFYCPGRTAELYPDQIRAIVDKGHELGHHGYLHEDVSSLSEQAQQEIIDKSQRIFREIAGTQAVGFRASGKGFNDLTRKVVMANGFRYSSSLRGDDRPYRTAINGVATDFIEIPGKWETDDFPQFGYSFFPPSPLSKDRIDSPRATFDNFTYEFEGYYRYGLCYTFISHPQIIGKPGRVEQLDKLIEHMQEKGDVWFATGSEIAQWWLQNY